MAVRLVISPSIKDLSKSVLPITIYRIGIKLKVKKQQATGRRLGGAIAPSPTDAILGVAESVGSKKEAEQIALKDCKAKGGKDCKVNLAYHNQCAVMIVGDESLESYGNATIAEATQRGLADCNQREKGCRVYYSACAKPIYHRR